MPKEIKWRIDKVLPSVYQLIKNDIPVGRVYRWSGAYEPWQLPFIVSRLIRNNTPVNLCDAISLTVLSKEMKKPRRP